MLIRKAPVMARLGGAACCCVIMAQAFSAQAEQPIKDPGIAAFNAAFTAATRNMDDAATLSLWEDGGISLLPGTDPIHGKAAIAALIAGFRSAHPRARMESFTNTCFDLEASGPWASEWCLEHQIVSEPGKPTFDSWGKMLLVLHQQRSGEWRLVREMWNQASPPAK